MLTHKRVLIHKVCGLTIMLIKELLRILLSMLSNCLIIYANESLTYAHYSSVLIGYKNILDSSTCFYDILSGLGFLTYALTYTLTYTLAYSLINPL